MMVVITSLALEGEREVAGSDIWYFVVDLYMIIKDK
jgi:hypothetical protein